mgnify:FL=1
MQTATSAPLVDVAVALILRRHPTAGDPPAHPHPTSPRGDRPHRHQILITQRRPGAVYAGYWEFPGGKIEPGETPVDAAVRAVREELACRARPTRVLPQIIHTYEHATVRLHPVLSRLHPSGPEPVAREVADWRWSPLDRLPWAEFLPANVRVVTALVRALTDADPLDR